MTIRKKGMIRTNTKPTSSYFNGNGNVDGDDEDDDDDQQDIDQFDGDALEMVQKLEQLARTHTQAILTKHGAADGSNELNKMWSQFVRFKKEMDRPSDAPMAYTVPDKTSPFVELRDMLEALPFDLSCAILQEQQMNPYDRIKDVTLQRGCWPMVRFVKNNRVTTINKVFIKFDDILNRLEMYLKSEKIKEMYVLICQQLVADLLLNINQVNFIRYFRSTNDHGLDYIKLHQLYDNEMKQFIPSLL